MKTNPFSIARTMIAAAIAVAGIAAPLALPPAAYAAPVAAYGDYAGAINWRTDISDALADAKRDNKPVLLSFTASWCPYCRQMDNETFTDSGVIRLSRDFVCIQVDTDTELGGALFHSLGYKSVPTILLVSKNGKKTMTGFQDADDLVSALYDNRP